MGLFVALVADVGRRETLWVKSYFVENQVSIKSDKSIVSI